MSDDVEDARSLSRRAMIAGGALAVTSVFADLHRPHIPLRMLPAGGQLSNLIPKKIGSWDYEGTGGLVLPPQDQLRDHIYNRLLTRYYSSPSTLPIMLLIAYSGAQDGVLQVHRPEVCYPAAGYELLANSFDPIDVGGGLTVPAHFISARSNSRHEQLIYWTRIGNAFPTRWWEQHVAVAQENLIGRVPDGVLVRISTAAQTDKDAIAVLEYFMRTLVPLLSPLARRVLFGEHGAIPVRAPAKK